MRNLMDNNRAQEHRYLKYYKDYVILHIVLYLIINKNMKVCEICGKGSKMGGHRIKLRGKYNPQPTTRKYPKLQSTRLSSGKKVVAFAPRVKKQNPGGVAQSRG